LRYLSEPITLKTQSQIALDAIKERLNDICHGRAGAEVIQPMLEAFEVCFYMTEIITTILVAGHHAHNSFSMPTIVIDCHLVLFFYYAAYQNLTFQKRKLTDYKIIMRDDFVDLENEVRNLLSKHLANVEGRPSAQCYFL
jgi:hypothetical protein